MDAAEAEAAVSDVVAVVLEETEAIKIKDHQNK